jgi:hypothetical protein
MKLKIYQLCRTKKKHRAWIPIQFRSRHVHYSRHHGQAFMNTHFVSKQHRASGVHKSIDGYIRYKRLRGYSMLNEQGPSSYRACLSASTRPSYWLNFRNTTSSIPCSVTLFIAYDTPGHIFRISATSTIFYPLVRNKLSPILNRNFKSITARLIYRADSRSATY